MKLASFFKQQAVAILEPLISLPEEQCIHMLEVPPQIEMGDLAFPCYLLAKTWRRSPQAIAVELTASIQNHSASFVQATAVDAYVNLKWNREHYGAQLLSSLEGLVTG